MKQDLSVMIIGGGLAGCEAAVQAARLGVKCRLYEMKPRRFSPAHRSENLAELVCSNSLKSELMTNASGLLKAEMKLLGSVVMEAAEQARVPAGQALAVDREVFSARVTGLVLSRPEVELVREEVERIPDKGIVVIATGPLTSEALSASLKELTGEESLFFYDAIAPVVFAESLDESVCFRASRYGRGEGDYINCPMTKEEYDRFVDALVSAEKAPIRDFEEGRYFEGCLPVEVMAERGRETLAHGPLKPVGLSDPRTGKRPYAVVQLRMEDKEGRLFNLVGFQTRLKYGEQERVFRMIPGLEKAEFARLGSMHRNTFIQSPELLEPTLCLRKDPRIFFAGQITGVEGYLESSAMGIIAGINAARAARGLEGIFPPPSTATGSLLNYITSRPAKEFQPMNINFGIMASDVKAKNRKQKKDAIVKRAIEDMQKFASRVE